MIAYALTSCEDFLEVDPPDNQLIGTEVFENADTVDAAFAHIYGQLREGAFTGGYSGGLSYRLGHYADELELYNLTISDVVNFSNTSVLASDPIVENWWNSSYNLIYAVNNIIEGVEASTDLDDEDRSRFLGECYFLRAYIHFHLTNLFGAVPYITTTDYRINRNVSRLEEADVYDHIMADFIEAKSQLSATLSSSDNFRPNYWAASAMLARTYLYNNEWQLALDEASDLLSNSDYSLESDLSEVFLKNSPESIWQLDSGQAGTNTREGITFIFVTGPPPNSALSNFLLDDFETGDARFTNWLGAVSEGSETWYYPFKYKLNLPTGSTEECSILIRLAEVYLIAAEASAALGDLPQALNYLNAIRIRASLNVLNSTNQTEVLDFILQERRIEFFSEQGHRFFDLKRTNSATETLSPIKPNWQSTKLLFPIPESELITNSNLLPQNEGY
jgi:hypothetical protein